MWIDSSPVFHKERSLFHGVPTEGNLEDICGDLILDDTEKPLTLIRSESLYNMKPHHIMCLVFLFHYFWLKQPVSFTPLTTDIWLPWCCFFAACGFKKWILPLRCRFYKKMFKKRRIKVFTLNNTLAPCLFLI